MQLDSAIHISLIQKRLSDSYQPRQQCDFSIFVSWDYYNGVSVTVDLVLQY